MRRLGLRKLTQVLCQDRLEVKGTRFLCSGWEPVSKSQVSQIPLGQQHGGESAGVPKFSSAPGPGQVQGEHPPFIVC